MVETAFILLLFISFIFGLLDFGFGILQVSQATSGARDGARVGILNYKAAAGDLYASTPAAGSDQDKIKKAIVARLAGQKVTSAVVSCQDSAGVALASCATATPDVDKIRVVVTWDYRPLTFVGAFVGTRSITGTATMTIVGLPT